MNSLGAKIQILLKARGLSQLDLAKLLDVHPSNISALISGKRGGFKAERIPVLARALGVTSDYLLDDEIDRLPPPPDERRDAIVDVMSAIEFLGWEEVSRRIHAAGSMVPPEKRGPVVINFPDEPIPVDEDMKPRKLGPGDRASRKPKGEDH